MEVALRHSFIPYRYFLYRDKKLIAFADFRHIRLILSAFRHEIMMFDMGKYKEALLDFSRLEEFMNRSIFSQNIVGIPT